MELGSYDGTWSTEYNGTTFVTTFQILDDGTGQRTSYHLHIYEKEDMLSCHRRSVLLYHICRICSGI